jgi:nicotinamide riboside transporter PnuC
MIGWLAFMVTCFGVVLTSRKNIWCWAFLIVANFLWAYHLWGDTSAVTMQVALFVLNVHGWRQWNGK